MRKRLAVFLTCVLLASMPISAAAEALQPQDYAARYQFVNHSAPLTERNQEMAELGAVYDPTSTESAAEMAEAYALRLEATDAYTAAVAELTLDLKLRLIDYDLSLKRLRPMLRRYQNLCRSCEEGEQAYRLGQLDRDSRQALLAEREAMLLEIRSAVRDISLAKAAIERITGETLKDSYDFDSLYYITDAVKLAAALPEGVGGWDTICYPVGYTPAAASAPDYAKELDAAQTAYYELGKRLRAYIPVARLYEQTHQAFLLGQADAATLEEAELAKEDGALAVWDAKAAYAKSLLTLDHALGGALTQAYTAGELLQASYTEIIPEDMRGDGLWGIRRFGDSKQFVPMALPHTLSEVEGVSYRLTYNGQVIGEAAAGQACILADAEFDPAARYAYITFSYEGAAKTFAVDVFSPVGSFTYGEGGS